MPACVGEKKLQEAQTHTPKRVSCLWLLVIIPGMSGLHLLVTHCFQDNHNGGKLERIPRHLQEVVVMTPSLFKKRNERERERGKNTWWDGHTHSRDPWLRHPHWRHVAVVKISIAMSHWKSSCGSVLSPDSSDRKSVTLRVESRLVLLGRGLSYANCSILWMNYVLLCFEA